MNTNKIAPSNSEKASGYVFFNSEALDLYERLERVVGLGAAQLFKDACILIDPEEASPLSHVPYLAGHSLRELDSSIFGIIDPFLTQKKSRAERIDDSLALLECTDEGLGERLKATNLHSIAHRDGLSESKGISEEFRNLFFDLIKAYGEFIRLCESKFPLWHQRADELLKQPHCPKKLKSELPRNRALMRYLFDKLDKSEWFKGLRKQGFLDYTTADNIGDWPQIHYLIKIADQLPQEVLELLLSIETENPWLLSQFCEAAMKMPMEQCEAWAEHLASRIPTDPANAVSTFMYHIPQFIKHLIGLESDWAFKLTDQILDVSEAENSGYDKFHTRMDRYHYQEVLKDVIPGLTDLDARKSAELLANKLDQVIKLGWSDRWNDNDGSDAFWLPAIEDHSQNQDHYVEGSIAVALRSVLEVALGKGGDVEQWLEWLGHRNSLVYLRMSIHLIRLHGSVDGIEAWLLKKELFENSHVLHEYLLLLQHGFPMIGKIAQDQLLSWIDAFPEYDGIPEEHREKRRQWQQYRRLAFIVGSLDAEWRMRYDEMASGMEENDLNRLSFDRWMEVAHFVEDKSPIPPEEVANMSVKELVDYLTSEIRFDDFREITERGLEQAITGAVATTPEKYTENLKVLKNPAIKPLFVRGITNGLLKEPSEPVADKVQLDWMRWCVELPPWEGEHDGKPYTRGHEDNKKVILGMLQGRMSSKASHPLPLECRKASFEIIQAGLNDPDPAPDRQMSDPHSTAINSVRGCAMEAALDYGLWVLRGFGRDDPQSFECLPELRDVLDKHLDCEQEPTPAVRSCYGLYIPQLCWMGQRLDCRKCGDDFSRRSDVF